MDTINIRKKYIILLSALIILCALFCCGASADTYGNYTYSVSNGEATITNFNGSGAVTIPSTLGGYPVTAIGGSGFNSNTRVTSVVIPEGVTSIGSDTFTACTNLAYVSLPSSLTTIGHTAFADCTALTSVFIPKGVTSIDPSAFYACSNLESISVSSQNANYSSYNSVLFDKNMSALCIFPAGIAGSYTVPEGVTTIGEYAFDAGVDDSFNTCSKLTEIILPQSLTTIGYNAFHSCSITTMVIPDGVTEIGFHAFYDCMALSSINIPEGITSIYSGTFYGCKNLTQVTLPESLTTIAGTAFQNCSSLTSVNLPKNLTYIGTDSFKGVSESFEAKVYLDSYGLTYCKNNKIPYEIVDAFIVEDGVLVEYKDERKHVVIPGNVGITKIGDELFRRNSTITSVEIPEGVTEIGEKAFYDCIKLKEVSLPSTLTSLGDSCFNNTALESIVLPSGVTEIPNAAFGYTDLKQINLDNITSIGRFAFQCADFVNLVLPEGLTSLADNAFYSCASLKSVVIPESLTSIPGWAFVGCDVLASVTLHDKLTSIGTHAFAFCPALKRIAIPRSVVEIGTDAFANGNQALTIACHADSCADKYANAQGIATDVEAHREVTDDAVPATCTETGLTEGKHCSVCNEILVAQQEVPALGHTEVIDEAVPATCTEMGLTEGKHCSVCGEILIAQEIVPALGHTPSATQQIYEVNVGSETYVSFTCLCGHNEASLVKWESKNADIAVYTGAPDHADPGMITANFAGMSAGVTTVTADFIDEATEDCVFTIIVHGNKQMILPAMLRTVDEEAFMNAPVQEVILPEGMTVIGECAFANCAELVIIDMPDSIESIADDAFAGCKNVTFICASENVAATYAAEHGIPYVIVQ